MSRIAVHRGPGFSRRWVSRAVELGHSAREVNGYATEIIDQLRSFEVFLWHLSHDEPNDLEHARGVLLAAEAAGLRVFPNHATSWHFDDKIAQKYLLESVGAPLAPTWVFYSKKEALEYLDRAQYPLVFKLRRGAGSMNVRLIMNRREGRGIVRQMFRRGINAAPVRESIRRAAARARRKDHGGAPFRARLARAAGRITRQLLSTPRERGYVLFQKFIPENDHDLRATVIGERCFIFRRDVRPGDFRASGSGRISYFEEEEVPLDVVKTAFSISRKLGFQSMSYDFVRDPENAKAMVLEMSFVFNDVAVANCPGYLRPDCTWCDGQAWPQDAILEDLLSPAVRS